MHLDGVDASHTIDTGLRFIFVVNYLSLLIQILSLNMFMIDFYNWQEIVVVF